MFFSIPLSSIFLYELETNFPGDKQRTALS